MKLKWRSTKECIEFIESLRCEVKIERKQDSRWWSWKIIMLKQFCWGTDTYAICESGETFNYQDEAANAAYLFAWKHIRKRRVQKKRKGE